MNNKTNGKNITKSDSNNRLLSFLTSKKKSSENTDANGLSTGINNMKLNRKDFFPNFSF